jgi:sugar phosphate isomerase/epimerase
VANALGKLADHAADRSVLLALETHDDWCAPGDVAAVMAAVGHPAVGVNWDLLHPVRTGGATMEQAFAILGPWIRHVHVHDASPDTEPLQWRPIGEGIVDHRVALRLLGQLGYDGFVSGEWIKWAPPEVHLPRELERLRAIAAEPAR